MPHILNFSDADFEERFRGFQELKRDLDADVDAVVTDILADVRAHGIEAVLALTQKFDRIALTPETIALSPDEIDAAIARVSPEERSALELAADRIRAFHERQMPQDALWQDDAGATLGWRWTPVDKAGLYVPGGLASYPSSVLMNAVPATVAGVKDIVMCAPTPDGALNPLVVLAARLGGVQTIYRIGGAQAIAAMAFGAGPIQPVDKITGPGNAFVAAAKRQVFGKVGIDMIAGPSEVLVIAEPGNDPDWIALDLMAQAEHDASAQSILVTTDSAFADKVLTAVEARLQTLGRREIAAASWRDYGGVIIVDTLENAAEIANRIAPEHLEILTTEPNAVMDMIRHAGAIFLGAHTPEAVGDYVGGPNHVLPTSGSARFSSGLSVLDFMKRTTISGMSTGALRAIGGAASTLARSEGLEAHALSVEQRMEQLN